MFFLLGNRPKIRIINTGQIVDRHDVRGRPKKFEDPSAEDTIKMLAIHDLTSEDVEMAGQDAYEQIHQHMSDVSKLNEPYEEGLTFEKLCNKILSE